MVAMGAGLECGDGVTLTVMGRKCKSQRAAEVRKCRTIWKSQQAELVKQRPDAALRLREKSLKDAAERQQRFRDRRQKETDIAARMAARWWPSVDEPPPSPIVLYYEYWVALAAGWDMLSKEFSRDSAGKICDPALGAVWCWWFSILNRDERKGYAMMNRIKLYRPSLFHPLSA